MDHDSAIAQKHGTLRNSPALIRAVPFLIFLLLTFCQDLFGGAWRYWFYFAKTIAGAVMIWMMRPLVAEMRWKTSWQAFVAGLLVFLIWIGLDGFYPKLKISGASWNPHSYFGMDTALAWFFIVVRIAGSTLIVPPLEELFFRSFLYRFIAKPDFQSVPLGQFLWLPFLITSLLFGFEHREWLPGILAGFIFQGLVCWKKRLGDAITAHAIANLCLGLWVITKDAWHYW